MDQEATLSSTERTYRTGSVTHSLAAVPISSQGGKPGVLEVVCKTGEAHYTEENLTILVIS